MFTNLINEIVKLGVGIQQGELDFSKASNKLVEYVDEYPNFSELLDEIGVIPECLEHDSTEEKLFSKASDAVLARAFCLLGLKAVVLSERGNSADVQAVSRFHGYSLVADAKAFRLSRTAKNQKDFKVVALSGWRKDADYAVLCAPYFQYPKSRSQIYAQAVDHNVCLLSWEQLSFLIKNGISETEKVSLAPLWNISAEYAQHCVVAEKNRCSISLITTKLVRISQKKESDFLVSLNEARSELIQRANFEISYLAEVELRIREYSREQAIAELLQVHKIDERKVQIQKFVKGLANG